MSRMKWQKIGKKVSPEVLFREITRQPDEEGGLV